ncbi:TIGR04255 family protein [Streptomyces sp. NPDC001941]|uniref:TIGR04255 family protein n=1 Tax=Streptomyces sp. NPDC001941 TaxID=3154659 RepID=UPI003316C2BC
MTSALKFRRPPVYDVTLALMFGNLSKLQTLDLAPLRVGWSTDYPVLQESTPLPAWEPSELDAVEFVRSGLAWPMALCTLSAEEGDRKVKFQQDRFILNWNFGGEDLPYPGYEALKEELVTKFDEFSKLAQSISGSLPEVRRVDVTYSNRLPGVSAHEAITGVLTGWNTPSDIPFRVPDYCGFRVRYQESELDARVRVLVGIDSAVTESDGEFSSGSSLLIDAESLVEGPDDFAERLDVAHEVVTNAFVEATSEEMRFSWGENE